MTTFTEQDVADIKQALKDLQKDVSTLLTTKAVQEREHEWIREHQDLLHGTKNGPGLVAQVDRHERWILVRDRIMWALLSVFITEVGVGIIFFAKFAMGPTP